MKHLYFEYLNKCQSSRLNHMTYYWSKQLLNQGSPEKNTLFAIADAVG